MSERNCLLCFQNSKLTSFCLETFEVINEIFIKLFNQGDIIKKLSSTICDNCLTRLEIINSYISYVRSVFDTHIKSAQIYDNKTYSLERFHKVFYDDSLLKPKYIENVDVRNTESRGVIDLVTNKVVRQCKECYLIFSSKTELNYHENNHERKRKVKKEAVKNEKKFNKYNISNGVQQNFSQTVLYRCAFCKNTLTNRSDHSWHEAVCVGMQAAAMDNDTNRTRSSSRLSKRSNSPTIIMQEVPISDDETTDVPEVFSEINSETDTMSVSSLGSSKSRPRSAASTASSTSSKRKRSRSKRTRWTHRKKSKHGYTYKQSHSDHEESSTDEAAAFLWPTGSLDRINILNNENIKSKVIKPTQRLFKCTKKRCYFYSEDVDLITQHEVEKHKYLALYPCVECNKKYTNNSFLSNHKKQCHPKGPIMCTRCDVCITSQSKLLKHLDHHNEVVLKCAKCDFSFCDKESLVRHTLYTTDKKHLRKEPSPTRIRHYTVSAQQSCDNNDFILISDVQSLNSSRPSTPYCESEYDRFSDQFSTTEEFEPFRNSHAMIKLERLEEDNDSRLSPTISEYLDLTDNDCDSLDNSTTFEFFHTESNQESNELPTIASFSELVEQLPAESSIDNSDFLNEVVLTSSVNVEVEDDGVNSKCNNSAKELNEFNVNVVDGCFSECVVNSSEEKQ